MGEKGNEMSDLHILETAARPYAGPGETSRMGVRGENLRTWTMCERHAGRPFFRLDGGPWHHSADVPAGASPFCFAVLQTPIVAAVSR